jgi:hypothetical protein
MVLRAGLRSQFHYVEVTFTGEEACMDIGSLNLETRLSSLY